jgi:hypothetical protein
MRKIALGILILTCFCSLNGCKDLQAAREALRQEQRGENPASPEKKEEDSQDLVSYKQYLAFSNLMNGRVEELLELYFQGVEGKTEFHPIDGGSYISQSFQSKDYNALNSASVFAGQGTKYKEVDEAVQNVAPVLESLMRILDEAAFLGQEGGITNENYDRAKEIHDRLVTVLSSYDELRPSLYKAIRSMTKFEQEKDLQRYQSNGMKIRYYALSLLMKKSEIMTLLSGQENISDANLLSLDTTELQEKYEEFIELFQAFNALPKDKDALIREGFPDYALARLSLYSMEGSEFKNQLKALLERVEEARDFTEEEKMHLEDADGSILKLWKAALALTEHYNKLIS